jgi:hypothetical protein
MNLDTAFRSIYGRDPSPDETNRFNRIGKELDTCAKVAFQHNKRLHDSQSRTLRRERNHEISAVKLHSTSLLLRFERIRFVTLNDHSSAKHIFTGFESEFGTGN